MQGYPAKVAIEGSELRNQQRVWTAPSLAEQDRLNAQLLAEKELLAQRTRAFLLQQKMIERQKHL